MGVHALLWSVVHLVFQPFKFSFIFLYQCLGALVRRSLRYMAYSQRSIQYRTMGNDRSKLIYSEDFNTEYDSTWEDENDDCEEVQSSKSVSRRSYSEERKTYAAKDMQNFRHMIRKVRFDDTDYEELNKLDSEEKLFLPNLRFYQSKQKSIPDDVSIEEFHSKWSSDYKRLEWVHSYIQWLFPIQERGVNYDAYVLTPEEIMLFRRDEMAKERLLQSYRLMLDFYGIELCNEETGEVCRADNWKERFQNLDRNTHNNLRISRILKCLGILGFQHYQAPLVRFFLEETLVNGNLPRVKRSVLDYFMFAVLDRSERKQLIRFAFEKFEPKDEFVWCPKRIQRRFNRAAETPETVHSESEPGKSNEEASHPPELESHQNGQSNDVGESQDANQNLTENKTDDSNGSDESQDDKKQTDFTSAQSNRAAENVHGPEKVNADSLNQTPSINISLDATGDSRKVSDNQGHGSEDNKNLERSIEGDIPKTDHSESCARNEETPPKPKLESSSLVPDGSSNVAKTTGVTQDSPDNMADEKVEEVPQADNPDHKDHKDIVPNEEAPVSGEVSNEKSDMNCKNKQTVIQTQNLDKPPNHSTTTTTPNEHMQEDDESTDASADTESGNKNVSDGDPTSDKMLVDGIDTGIEGSPGISNTLHDATGAPENTGKSGIHEINKEVESMEIDTSI